MNDNTAAGVNYGMFRRNQFNETATHVLVYDMGATKTTATVLEYQIVKEKNGEKNPQMSVLGVGYETATAHTAFRRARALAVCRFV